MLPKTEPERRLAAAILRRAALDARNGNGRAAEARRWLAEGEHAADLLGALDLHQDRAREWIDELPEPRQPGLEL